MSKKLLGLFAGIVFTVSVMVVPVKAEVPDIGDLSKYSNEQLVAMILEMLTPGSSAETDTTTPQTGSSNWVSLGIPQGFQFNTNLKLGMTSNDVKYLQIMLNSDPDTAVAITGAGSKGNETTYFGGLTQQAVVKFQEKYASTVLTPLGLTKGTGLAGAGTRVKLNEMLTQGVSDTPVDVSSLGMIECVTKGYKWDGTKCYTDEVVDVDVSSLGMIECVTKGYAWNGTKCYDPKAEDGETPVVKPVEGAGLEVALASDSPATSLVTGQSAAPLAKFVLTNKDAVEAKITRVELQRIGVSADATLANVYLFQGLTRLTDSAAISQGKIAFNNPNGIITVPAGSSVVLTVASDIDTGTSGQTIGISLNSVQSNVEVKALPVRGHVQTVADAELAKVTVGTVVPESEDSVNAGTANYTVFQAPLTVSKRAVNLKAVTLKAIGSIPTDAFENVQLYVNGVEVGSPIVLTSEGMATFILDTPHEIQSGSAILEVRADIVKGSSRNFSFSLQNAADLIAVDTDYNVYTQVAGVPKTTALITINEGTVSVSQDSTFDATTVTGGVSNAVLAKYSFKAFGENVKVSYLDVESSVNLDNVSIYVNGAPVTSNVNYTGTKLHFSLGSSLIIPAGQTVSVEVRGDTKVNGEKLANAINIKMTLVPYTNNAQGVSSSKMITVPSIKIEGQELTVGSGELTISKRSGVTNSNISPNTDNQRIGAFTIQAGDSEAVRINNFNVKLDGASTVDVKQLSDLYIKYGSSETTPNPSVHSNNNLSTSGVVVPAGESMNVDVYVSVANVQQQTTTSSADMAVSFNSTNDYFTATVTGTALSTDKFELTFEDSAQAEADVVEYTADETLTAEQVAKKIEEAITTAHGSDKPLNGKVTKAVATNNTIFVVLAGNSTFNSITKTVTNGATSVTASPKLQATLGVSATGVSSNTTLNVTEKAGQIITVATANLSAPELSATSAASQFVLGDSDAQAAKYSFIATGGSVTIQKLKFGVANSDAIESITIDGKTQTVYGNEVTVTGLSINIPETRTGKDIEVKAKYNEVGLKGIDATVGVRLTLKEVEYRSGNTTKTIKNGNGMSDVSSSPMYIVAGYPAKVELKKVSNSLADGKVKIAELTITPAGDSILLKKLPIKVTLTGTGVFDGSSSKIYAEGLLGSGVSAELGDTATAEQEIIFNGDTGLEIAKAETFSIYVDVVSGTVKDDKLTTSLGAKASFVFQDIEGNSGDIGGDDDIYLLKENYDESASVEITY